MSKIDEFESLFLSADKPVFKLQPIAVHNVCIVADPKITGVDELIERTEKYLSVLQSGDDPIAIHRISGPEFNSVDQLIAALRKRDADLICTYRNLKSRLDDHPYSLGEYVDVLTQATEIPLLLLPRPETLAADVLVHSNRVMLMTDHLSGDSRLVSWGVRFTRDQGELTLAHVEDEQTFERYIEVISKIPSIDTETAREEIKEQLLKEPTDFVASCREGIQRAGLPIEVRPLVTIGHHLTDYKKLVQQNQTDLLILHTKDEDQLAMHGLAYPVTIELRDIPLLLL